MIATHCMPHFSNVVILGVGAMAARCAMVLLANGFRPHKIIETGLQALSSLEGVARRAGVPFERASGALLTRKLERLEGPTLLLSINNDYLFPATLCSRKEVRIVNFHNSLLPRYPGRHIATWAVFHGEERHGSTWHLVDRGVDSGNILCQGEFAVPPHATALALMTEAIRVGVELFSNHWARLADPSNPGVPHRRETLFYSWELPLGGYYPLRNDFLLADRFLRSLDYGPLDVLPRPQLRWKGASFVVDRYRVLRGEKHPGRNKVAELGDGRWAASIGYAEGVIELSMSEEKSHDSSAEPLELVAS